MKKLFATIVFALACTCVNAQNQTMELSFNEDGCFSTVIPVNATAQQIYTHVQSYCLNKARASDKPIANKVPETYTIRYTDFWTHGVYANVVGQNKDVAEKCNITFSAQDSKMYIHIESPNIIYPRVNEQTQYKVFLAMLKEEGKPKLLETRKIYYSEFLSPIKDFIEKRVNFEK